jgi:hypothetical protein
MYIGMEGPGLVETAKQRPERFGSQLTESLGLWGAMSTSIIRGSKEFKLETQPRTTTDYMGGFKRESLPTKQDNIIQDFIGRNKETKHLKDVARQEAKTANQKLSSRLGIGDDVLNKKIDTWKTEHVHTPSNKKPYHVEEKNPYYEIKKERLIPETTAAEKTTVTANELEYIQQHPETIKWSKTKEIAGTRTSDYLGYGNKDQAILLEFRKTPMTESESQEAMKHLSTKGGYDPNKFLREKPNKKIDTLGTPSGDISGKAITQKRAIQQTGEDTNKAMKGLNLEMKPSDIKRKKMFGDSNISTKQPDWIRSITEGEKPERIITGKNRASDIFRKREIKKFFKDTRASIGKLGSRTDEIIQRRLRRPGYEGSELAKRKNRAIDNWEQRRINTRKTGPNTFDEPMAKRYWNERLSKTDFKLGDLGIFATGTIGVLKPRVDILTGRGIIDTQETYTGILTDQPPRTDFFEDTGNDTTTINDTDIGTIPVTRTITRQRQQTRTDQRLRTDYITKPTPTTTRRTRYTPPRPTPDNTPWKPPYIPRLPNNEQETEKTIIKQNREQIGFIPQVHEKGRWIDLTKKTLTQREAKNFLGETLDQSKAAVGRLRPSKGKLQALGITTKDFNLIARKFKEKDNLLIEKKRYRLDTKDEKTQITALGHAKNRLKGIENRNNRNNMFGGKQQPRNLPTKIKRTNRRTRYV